MNNKADILKILKGQLEYHKTEVKRIECAIQAYVGGVCASSEKIFTTSEKKTKWTKEIETIFKTKDNLTADEIQNLLVENGVELAREPRGRSAMLTTLSRMVKNRDKDLTLTDEGYYKKARKLKRIIKPEIENDPSEENTFESNKI